MAIEVTHVVPPSDQELDQQWERAEPEGGATGVDWELLAVEALHSPGDDHWQVVVSMAEFIRADPLQARMSEAVTAALAAVPGVLRCVRDDTETWVAFGTPSGADLVRAASAAVDAVYPAARDEREQARRQARSRRPAPARPHPANGSVPGPPGPPGPPPTAPPSAGSLISCFVLAVVGVLLVVVGLVQGAGSTLVIGAVAVVIFGAGLALLLRARRNA